MSSNFYLDLERALKTARGQAKLLIQRKLEEESQSSDIQIDFVPTSLESAKNGSRSGASSRTNAKTRNPTNASSKENGKTGSHVGTNSRANAKTRSPNRISNQDRDKTGSLANKSSGQSGSPSTAASVSPNESPSDNSSRRSDAIVASDDTEALGLSSALTDCNSGENGAKHMESDLQVSLINFTELTYYCMLFCKLLSKRMAGPSMNRAQFSH